MKARLLFAFVLGATACLPLYGAVAPGNSTYDITARTAVPVSAVAPGPRRIEGEIAYDHLTPYDDYGAWKTITGSFYDHPFTSFSYMVQLSGHTRKEGDGITATAGAYKDWTSWFYTYAALSGGTANDFLPRFRGDLDLNFKAGPMKNLVFTTGISRIDYHTSARDTLLSAGATLYLSRLILEYRLFHNSSDPGSVESWSHVATAGYGAEGDQWTYLVLSGGGEAYLATYVAPSQQVDRTFVSVQLKHRRWISPSWGLFGSTGFLRLYNGYDKYSLSLGGFYSF